MGRGILRAPWTRCGNRADQRAQRAWIFPQRLPVRARPDYRAEDSEPEAAVRHLSLPDHPWRRHHALARNDADHWSRPDRQYSLTQRARWRGTELSVPVQ